ncbi:phenylalanine--tRNA ligase subunit beta [Aestuariirhabdus sp. Z084]|uniref:phenylalanine--tRNA ligase subunit beta n=1 Tax=Aestuariirhabdus haliotis TaxID=2918751 RepID=UPI00201B3DB3|nr:phenylalanine--tRNA ligase subunit beta [Aestuariirhabdus haliotis]MCL6415476.1 phenylalanine--tRNA ligase subunit beta [Aestuariirhabdus haliotis]MCL6419319.1 phenylalanine--tRNA ligase subunit beta [Aestuariirhabdus haliotis]
MKFSEQWLRQWVDPKATTEELAQQITMAGLEVDGIEPVASEFSGVVVGEILSAEQHPDADKLRVCRVTDGSEEFQVVCGAPNARAGIKVPFARVGAVLPGNFKIKKAKLRGVESFGMLCAEDELGISDDHDGLMELQLDAHVGVDLRTFLSLDDRIIDVDLTPNRADCLSIAGIAREVGVNYRESVDEVSVNAVPATIDDQFPVTLDAPEDCPRYVGRVLRNVNVGASSPLWMVERLRRSGVRSIDPIVDVTNYVMLELGQPMHGFDLAQLSGSISVRRAQQGEKLTLLDGQEVTLTPDLLLIADQQRPLALAGIMGGEASGVSAQTCDIFLESAFFNPITIAGKARGFGLHTDSSHRFERGVDHQLQVKAIERATALILETCGGEPGPVVETSSAAHLPVEPVITLRAKKVTDLLGIEIPHSEIEELLTRLGLKLEETETGVWQVRVPSYRFDIELEVDLIEELGRTYGYNRLPSSLPRMSLAMKPQAESKVALSTIRRTLVAQGYREAINYSFIDPKLQSLFQPDLEPVKLANPISAEMSVMRTSLIPGLVKTLQYNLNRQRSRVRLFESGLTFVPQAEGEMVQEFRLAGLIYGSRQPEGWTGDSSPVDFFDLKGDLEFIVHLGGNASDFSFQSVSGIPYLHPGQCAAVLKSGTEIGQIGALHPSIQASLGIESPVYLFEVSRPEGRVAQFSELSKYPEVRRDLAVIVDQEVNAADLKSVVRETAGDWLINLRLFDVYQGKGIDPHRKSLALGLTLQHPSRTLTDDEVNEIFTKVVSALEERFNATLRM